MPRNCAFGQVTLFVQNVAWLVAYGVGSLVVNSCSWTAVPLLSADHTESWSCVRCTPSAAHVLAAAPGRNNRAGPCLSRPPALAAGSCAAACGLPAAAWAVLIHWPGFNENPFSFYFRIKFIFKQKIHISLFRAPKIMKLVLLDS
jgi:hypothetical protein